VGDLDVFLYIIALLAGGVLAPFASNLGWKLAEYLDKRKLND